MALHFLVLHFFHLVFLAWGLGGATIAAILMAKAEKQPELMPSVMKLVEPVSKLIWIAIIGLILTGSITAAIGAAKGYYDPAILLIKHVAVAAVVINGLNITFRLLPKLKKSAAGPGSKPSNEFLKVKSHLKKSSIASLILWYLIVGLSVLM